MNQRSGPVDSRRFREFVKANHPDTGGDRETFERGLAEFRRSATRVPTPGLTTRRKPGMRRTVRRWWHRRGRSSPHR
jgi:hypothetical protein